jgi:hypothetical protein
MTTSVTVNIKFSNRLGFTSATDFTISGSVSNVESVGTGSGLKSVQSSGSASEISVTFGSTGKGSITSLVSGSMILIVTTLGWTGSPVCRKNRSRITSPALIRNDNATLAECAIFS